MASTLNFSIKNELLAFLRGTQPSIARGCERELKTAIRGTLGSLTRFHWVCEEMEQWQACTGGLLLLPGLDRPFARRLECRAGPSGKKFLENRFRQI